MSATELLMPPVIQDFEVKDKVRRVNSKKDEVLFGVIYRIENSVITVSCDDGTFLDVSLDRFRPGFHMYEDWGKVTDPSFLQAGSILSHVTFIDPTRVYATVTLFRDYQIGWPGVLEVSRDAGGKIVKTSFPLRTHHDLEKTLLGWELED